MWLKATAPAGQAGCTELRESLLIKTEIPRRSRKPSRINGCLKSCCSRSPSGDGSRKWEPISGKNERPTD